MPKYKKETAKRRAKKLTKTFIKNDCNQTKTAEELGITSQAVNQQIHSPIVQKTFQEVMEKAGITDERCADKMDEGFDCDRAIVVDKSIKYVPDNSTRHKYLTTALTIKGHLVPKIGLDDDTIDKIIRLPAKKAVGDPVDGTSAREG